MKIDNKKFSEILKQQKIKRLFLCQELNISSRTIAKIAKNEEINQKIIEKIANFLKIDMQNIIKHNEIFETLRKEKISKVHGGLYHETQIRMAYNSNHIEGSVLTEKQTRYIFETETIGSLPTNAKLDDVIETNNHFKCFDYIIDNAELGLNIDLIKNLHFILKQGTNYAKTFELGVFKKFPNVIGGKETTLPENVDREMKKLLKWYNGLKSAKLEDIVEFHYRFECIHPFQDGNGRIGRLLMFKECLKNNIVPFYIDDKFKAEYYNGLQKYSEEKGFLLETCLFSQDQYKMLLDYFRISY